MVRILFVLALLVLGSTAHAQGTDDRKSAFGEQGFYTLESSFTFQSTWGVSDIHDKTSTSGSATIGLVDGFIDLSTGTTPGSSANLETVLRGLYSPGRGAEGGLLVNIVNPPAGDGVVEWGLFDGDNGLYYRFHDSNGDGTNELCTVYERANVEKVDCEGEFKNTLPNSFGILNNAITWVIRFVYYGGGGADYFGYLPNENGIQGLREVLINTMVPAQGEALIDPNQPIRVRVDNGTSSSDITVSVGGRRFDTQGEFDPARQGSFARRTGQTVGTSWTPIICTRKKDNYPTAGRQNSTNAFVETITLETSTETVTAALAKVQTSDLTGNNFINPSGFDSGAVSVEYDTSSSAISNFTIVQGGYTFDAGANKNQPVMGTEQPNITVFRDAALCVIGKTDANTATVATTLRVTELR